MTILTLALIAHDTRKDALVAWAERHRAVLSGHRVVATGTTGQRLKEAIPELKVERVLSGPQGGDLQIGARVAEGRVDAIIFLIDPLWAQPHEPDVRALMRIAVVHDVPLALNLRTAEALVAGWPTVTVLAGG
ncbi:methylglyoxal synthase [Roseomonas sp. OT10]|uniref:methylglyoxal synthase n=1 Tax=Roseomonas cutis TaxID=2897332 RepID=UPI001E35E650|nr:methylglyoxal synthase [Roseomonas sp. OT10]UFN47014.1 methylglyoxal synthase [Roseomonas sp. OT10]